MLSYASLLERHQATINRLNVFPVPDGDTGTNMLLTVKAVATKIGPVDDIGEDADALADVCQKISYGSLMGARGNSGVILCQVLRGLATTCAETGSGSIDGATIAAAIGAGARAAREAVLRPAEGTILSVADGAAAAASALGRSEEGAATSAGDAGVSVISVVEHARSGAITALWRTPEQLGVLAQAGVVDAGGAGLVLLFDALLEALDGRAAPEALDLPPAVRATLDSVGSLGIAATERDDDALASLRYEVMYLLHAPDEAIPAFREVWAGVGDSIVVVGGDGLWNCHIHTDDIGAAIEAALDAGRPREIRVTDLAEQVEEESWVRQADPIESGVSLPDGPEPITSVVAVATGDGVRRIFGSLGVESIVAGGQSMNPSTSEILEAIESVRGADVVLLPNNSNIRPVAEQAALLATKKVRVVATRGMQEGFAALLDYDPQASGEENAQAMTTAAERVAAGEVTRAIRASESPAGAIAAGDFIGLSRAGVVSVASTLVEATSSLLAHLITDDHEIVTLIEGAGVGAAESRQITEWLRAHHPELTVERHQGGQPLYPFLVSVE